MHRRVHVSERPLVGGQLPVGVHVPFAEQEEQLLLGEVGIDEREGDAVKREVPRRVPRVFPLVGHGQDVGINDAVVHGRLDAVELGASGNQSGRLVPQGRSFGRLFRGAPASLRSRDEQRRRIRRLRGGLRPPQKEADQFYDDVTPVELSDDGRNVCARPSPA